MVDILHEMMHIAGFRHEFARTDEKNYLKVMEKDENIRSINYNNVDIGNLDYCSIMLYTTTCNSEKLPAKNKEIELKSQDFKNKTFSDHDLAAIKIIYGKKKQHLG
jgi:hypothetical protein